MAHRGRFERPTSELTVQHSTLELPVNKLLNLLFECVSFYVLLI